MKNLISFLLMLSAGYSYAWQIQGKEYQFEKLNDQVYVIHGPQADPSKDNEGFMNNPGLILAKMVLLSLTQEPLLILEEKYLMK